MTLRRISERMSTNSCVTQNVDRSAASMGHPLRSPHLYGASQPS